MKPRTLVLLAAALAYGQNSGTRLTFAIPGTAQSKCYDARAEIPCPAAGQPFHGQDAQNSGRTSYTLSADGKTITDNITGLVWQRSPGERKLTFAEAKALSAKLNVARFGGFDDWRLPSIKELYSLIVFSGIDPSGPEPPRAGLTPFIDTRYFQFAYGDEKAGERIIDSQYASSTLYVGRSPQNAGKLFGVNFADGRIKGYDLVMRDGATQKTFWVLCVRGNPRYGANDFADNNDGTITDRATGLMWTKADSAVGMDWQAALEWVQARNAAKHLGHADWRLPNAKELQSILDYTRTPATPSAFTFTAITNENGEADVPFYWTSTTHAGLMGGASAVYVAFGRASGWMPGPGGYRYVDIHGAGAQRSDPKAGDAARFPHGRGPQGDVIRIRNFVRMVR